jgi:hypothetical protein
VPALPAKFKQPVPPAIAVFAAESELACSRDGTSLNRQRWIPLKSLA